MDISSIFTHPESQIACRSLRETMTYGELYSRSENLAKELVHRGTKRVLVYGHKECMMLVAFLACLRAGATYIPCSTGLPHDRLVDIAEASHADLVLCAIGRGFSGSNKIPKENIKKLSQNPPETKVLLPEEIDGSSLAYVIFTSGASGIPRGIEATRDNLNNFIHWVDTAFTLSETPGRVLNMSMLSIDHSMVDIYYALTHGHTLIMTEQELKEDHTTLFRHFQTVNPHVIVTTPSVAEFCLERKNFNKALMPALEVIYLMGEALHRTTPHSLYERFPDVTIINAYGPTEATCNVCSCVITKEMCEAPIPIGDMNQGATQIAVMDQNEDIILEDGAEGEIVLIGPSVTAGYTDGSTGGFCEIDGKRAYRTGDIGVVREGKLYWIARKDSQVKVGGYRLESSDVEINICRIDGVIACGVIVQYGHLVAYVTLDKEKQMTPGQIRMAARQFLPQYMIPGIVRILDSMPMNDKGKLDRVRLAQL
ncbi:MAG: AMP-binding protein [Eubacteriales bacterium]|nr:AMP-binding protein [Eubacteriales bacterium]